MMAGGHGGSMTLTEDMWVRGWLNMSTHRHSDPTRGGLRSGLGDRL
jgi:hypothetical protein